MNEDTLSQTLIEHSQNFQLAYINNDFEDANAFMSTDFETTVFNSNGTDLIIQNQDNIENSGEGWDFNEFVMSNHSVAYSADQTTAVVVFNTDGSISFEGGEQNVPYHKIILKILEMVGTLTNSLCQIIPSRTLRIRPQR